MTYTVLPNALVAVGAKPFATTVQALRDNAAEAAWYTHTTSNVTSSRVNGTSYQNTTGRQIFVSASPVIQGSATVALLQTSPNNSTWTTISRAASGSGGSATYNIPISCVVPPGFYYRVTGANGGIAYWGETA